MKQEIPDAYNFDCITVIWYEYLYRNQQYRDVRIDAGEQHAGHHHDMHRRSNETTSG